MQGTHDGDIGARHGASSSRTLDGEVLLIVPPFAGLEMASLAAHILQACAREAGFEVRVLYANILLAAEIGPEAYTGICYGTSMPAMIGERFFAAAAYGLPPLGRWVERVRADYGNFRRASAAAGPEPISWEELERFESRTSAWAEAVAEEVAARPYKIVGCTTSFEQTAASLALIRRIKARRPDIIAVLGGANCEGEMAEGILSLGAPVDFVFSGESEVTWPEFLREYAQGRLPSEPIVSGHPCHDLDALPTPDYGEFFDQLAAYLPEMNPVNGVWLAYESSRGCWWGQKHHCTFCGLNGMGMRFREKAADRVIADLKDMTARYPVRKVCMVDNIMPHTYFRTLLPRLAEELPNLHIHYEQKANLSLEKVMALKAAGVAEVQPGIEALSTSLLRRMRKGVSAAQNVALLRYARSAGMALKWNLLHGFPGDRPEDYEETLALIPLLIHLQPPKGLFSLSIDRFSPYFSQAEEFGVRNLRPIESYADVFPPYADLFKIGYHFTADYPTGAHEKPEVIEAIKEELSAWRAAWLGTQPPAAHIHPVSPGLFVLHDSRGFAGIEEYSYLTREEAAAALAGGPTTDPEHLQWALARRLGVMLDGSLVPLATAEPAVLLQFVAREGSESSTAPAAAQCSAG